MLVPGVLWLIAAGPGYVLVAVVGIVLLGIREFYHLIEAKGAHPLWGFGLAAGAALPVVAYLGNEYHATILMTAVLLAVMVAQVGKAQITEALASISGTFFGVFYVGWLLTHAVTLRNFQRVVESKWGAGAGSLFDPNSGAFLLIFTLSAVVLCDAGAYFAGRAWGKRKLAPKISPGKTRRGRARRNRRGHARGAALQGHLRSALARRCRADLPWALAVPIALVLATAG